MRDFLHRLADALTGPALIACALVPFLALTYLAAWLLTFLLDATALPAFLAAWGITTIAGVYLVRQLPRVLSI